MPSNTDVSMYNQNPYKPVNPLEMMGQMNTMQQQMMQNRLLGAQLGLGPAYASAINPDGTVNSNKLISNVANNPLTAPMTPMAIQQSNEMNQPMQVYDAKGQPHYTARQTIQSQFQPNLDQEQISKTHARIKAMDDTMVKLMNKKDLTQGDVFTGIAGLYGDGHMDEKEGSQALQAVPTSPDGTPANADQLRGWLSNMHQQMQPVMQSFRDTYPEQGSNSNLAAGPVPGQVEAATTAATGSANQLNNLRQRVDGSNLRLLQLQQARKALEEGAQVGPGTDAVQTIKSFLTTHAPDFIKNAGVLPDEDSLVSRDKLEKYLMQNAVGQSSSMGASTNDKLAAAFSSNPNTTMLHKSIDDILKIAMGNERLGQAQLTLWNKAKQAPENFSDFATDWSTNVDPRAFAINEMSPKERAELVKELTPAERAKFKESALIAKNMGFAENLKQEARDMMQAEAAKKAAQSQVPAITPASLGAQ